MPQSKSILQICLSHSWGGLEMVAFEKAVELAADGWDCTTIVPEGSPLAEKLQQRQQPVCVLPSGARGLLQTSSFLRREFKSRAPAVVILQNLRDLKFVLLALWGLPRPRLVGFSHSFVGVSKKDIYHRWLYRALDVLIALTPSHAENLINHIAIQRQKVQVLPNSVDLSLFNPAKRSDKLRQEFDPSANSCLIGLVGRIDKSKGQKLLIQAASRLR